MRYWVCWPSGEPAPHDDLVSVRLLAMLPTSFLDVPEEPAEPSGEPSVVAAVDVSALWASLLARSRRKTCQGLRAAPAAAPGISFS